MWHKALPSLHFLQITSRARVLREAFCPRDADERESVIDNDVTMASTYLGIFILKTLEIYVGVAWQFKVQRSTKLSGFLKFSLI